MKLLKKTCLFVLCFLLLCGCHPNAVPNTDTDPAMMAEPFFLAMVTDFNETSVTVMPLKGEAERASCDRITFGTAELTPLGVRADDVVRIAYDGEIMETYPAQIRALAWEKAGDLRDIPFEENWIEKTAENGWYDYLSNDLIITAIFADCFLARGVNASYYTTKVNGVLSDEWCVGDQVYCTFDNFYYDSHNSRAEADMTSIAVSDYVPDPYACAKPVVYLYPEKETVVDVTLTLDGELTCTYPAYEQGWHVTAAPDGTLTDENGQTYNYLYWEGETDAEWDMTNGFCVKGEDTAAFLEDALTSLGLNRREANEFIVYWLPLMQDNPYNVITFQDIVYTEAAQLAVSPAPDTLIRVFMTFSASDTFVELPPQELTAPDRVGFTVVEWGGTVLS